ncbi:hypothetical protein BGZ93_002888 [Podila epicladia]|nr:hypothetical protein BGZ92_005347 [Podila epicladia]KAG0080726.1 hypothetical protein BGZ93_002888 [Podila epicladia]
MVRSIVPVKILAVIVAMTVAVLAAPAPTPAADAVTGATACVCRYADGWDRVAHCGDCNSEEILTVSSYYSEQNPVY